jgi:hypothetical protein
VGDYNLTTKNNMAITYPINDSDRFTVYNTETSAPLNDGRGKPMRGVAWGSVDKSQMISGLADNIKWLLDVKEAKPTYDSATQKITKNDTAYDVVNESATDAWTVTALTAEEIDDRTPAHVDIGGIKYDTSETSQNAFTRMMTLVTQSGMASTDNVDVKDCLGVSHTLTVEQFNADMVQFGLYCYTQFHA